MNENDTVRDRRTGNFILECKEFHHNCANNSHGTLLFYVLRGTCRAKYVSNNGDSNVMLRAKLLYQ